MEYAVRFAGAGFAHDAEHLAAVEVERNAVHRTHFTGVGEEGRVEIIDF
jgi:hypothetical protein